MVIKAFLATVGTGFAAGALALLTAPPAQAQSAALLDFQFTLPTARTTSAGVYAPDGRLVRTLWRGQALLAGTHSRSWDLRDDSGALAPVNTYTVRVVHHNLRYTWNGVVGSTSAQAGTTALHKTLFMPQSLTTSAGRVHYVSGYNEIQRMLHGFDLAQPQVNTNSGIEWLDPFSGPSMVASDGQRLYWTNGGGLSKVSFVAAFDLGTRWHHTFSAGTPKCLNLFPDGVNCYWYQNYPSVLEYRPDLSSPPTGLAVQRSGRLLAVAYGADNTVRLYDKFSGSLLRSFTTAGMRTGALNQLAMAPNGDLWVLTATGAERYTHLDTAPSRATVVTGFSKPLAVTVDPQDADSVWVADGGISQQIKRFNSTGQPGQPVGLPGGPAGQAAVSSERLCFTQSADREQTALAVDDNRTLWAVDTCNSRVVSVLASGKAGTTISFVPASYVSTVDSNNPTRVFANFLEFQVDYGRSLNDAGSWTLVRNWLPALPASLRDAWASNTGVGGFRTVQTLSNGRTYGVLAQANGTQALVELTAAGTLRPSTALPQREADWSNTLPVLYENGDMGYSKTVGNRLTVYRHRLMGFDTLANPRWSRLPLTVASVAADVASTPYFRNHVYTGALPPRFPITTTDKVVFFNGSVAADTGFHLGAVTNGGTAWSWQASPSGPLDGLGRFQTRASDVGIHYGGNNVFHDRRNIVYGYHGEFYTDLGNGRIGQANQFMHFLDNGLFIGQFGLASTRATAAVQPGLSGNAVSPTLVRHNGQTYLYHNDESTWGGVHRWQLEGIDDVVELKGRGQMGSRIALR